MATIKTLTLLQNRLEDHIYETAKKLEEIDSKLAAMEEKLKKWETPAEDHKAGRGGRSKKRRPTPAPDRPSVMVAAGVGEDPR